MQMRLVADAMFQSSRRLPVVDGVVSDRGVLSVVEEVATCREAAEELVNCR